jgi:cellulose synthase/poly-beta-1,6-N-acetylglucosamine synthase-like glycosyltransferase
MNPLVGAAILLSLLFLCLMLYLAMATLFYSEKKPLPEGNGTVGISIVIPFCNEAPGLRDLLESLMNQDYGHFEIVLVNDGSSDDFRAPIDPFLRSTQHHVKLVESNFDGQKKLTSKQQALDTGVAHAAHAYIAFTDADMEFDKQWLSSLARMIPAGHDLVFGHTVIRKSGKGFLQFIQSYQLEFLFAVAFAFHASGFPGSCMGNNLLLSKKAYLDVGGQAGIGYSIVEDRALFSSFKRHGMKVSPVFPFKALAETRPCNGLFGLFTQVFRWARGGLWERHDLAPFGILFFFQSVLLILALGSCTHGALSVFAFVNFGATIFFISCAFRKIASQEKVFLFPVYYAFLLVEIIAFFCRGAFRPSLSWKNRKL